MGDHQRGHFKENLGGNVDIRTVAPKLGSEAHTGTPMKKRALVQQSATSALPTTPARTEKSTSRVSAQSSSTPQISSTLMTQRQATAMSTPIPQQKSHNVTARVESKDHSSVESKGASEYSDFEAEQEVDHALEVENLENEEVAVLDSVEADYEAYEEEGDEQYGEEEREQITEEQEVIEIEPSELIRAEDEPWTAWPHDALAEHAAQMNLALLQLAEDIVQWRVHCASINRNGKEMYEQYVQQCHRLQRMSAQYKACKRDVAENRAKLATSADLASATEQRLQQQQDRFKSNIEACQMLKESLAAANRRIKELEEAKNQTTASAELALAQRETALSNALQLADSLSQSLDASKAQVEVLHDENQALHDELERTRSSAESNKRTLMAKVEQLQRENAEYSKQIDSLAETPEAHHVASKSMETSAPASSRAPVPETPSKRTMIAAGSSPQKRVEALSIRVETLRAHNANLEEQIARQEISMKMQLDEAAQNEMKWKAVAKEVQSELDEANAELENERAENEAIKRELAEADVVIAKSASELKRLESREASLVELKSELKQLKELAAHDEETKKEQEAKIERASGLEFELAETIAELDSARASLKQAEDDMRLLYLQHKSDKAELEATYRHEDYKARYAGAVSKSALLHQKLSHVLSFIASNATLVKLAGLTEDKSLEEALNGWNTFAALELAPSATPVSSSTPHSSTSSSMSTPSKSTASTSVRRVRKSIIASSSPMRSKAVPASPLLDTSSSSHKKTSRRVSVAGRRSSMAPQPSQADVELPGGDFSVMTQQQMTASIIEACRNWKTKANELATRVALLEKLVLKERQSKADELHELNQDHAERLQTHMDALQLSHDAHASGLQAEINAQREMLEGQTEAFRSLHAAYLFLCEQSEILKIRLHESTCDLITYKATYEEAKSVAKEMADCEQQRLSAALEDLELALQQTKESYEHTVAQLKEELEARDETINFLENEGEAARETESEARKTLSEEHNTLVAQMELQIETQQHHIESQDANIESLTSQLQEALTLQASQESIIAQRETALLATALVLQHTEEARGTLLNSWNDSTAEVLAANTLVVQLENQLDTAEVLLGRTKGSLMAQTAQGIALKRKLEAYVAHTAQLRQTIADYDSRLQIALKEKQEELSAQIETTMKLQQAESVFAAQKASFEAELATARAELVQTTTDHRIAMVSIESRLESATLELTDVSSALSATQEEYERTKIALEEEVERAESLVSQLEESSRQLEAKAMESEDLMQRLDLAHTDASTAQKHCDEIEARLETVKEELVAHMMKIGATEKEMELMREALTLQVSEKLREVEQLRQEMEHKHGELEMATADVEHLNKEREALMKNVAGFEASRSQLEQVVKQLEISQEELQSANVSLEKQLAIERDEKEKLCVQISNLQTSLTDQMLQAQSQHAMQQQELQIQLQQQQEQLSNMDRLSSSQALMKESQEKEELARLQKEHDTWLEQIKQALLDASKAFATDMVAKRIEMDQECAALRARITTLENSILEIEDSKEALEEQIRYHVNDLSIAKLSHRLLLLQNGNLANVIEMQGVALAKLSTSSSSSCGLVSDASTSSSSSSSSSSASSAASQQAVLAIVAPDMKNMMKLQRQAQSLVLKAQQLEEENRQLKNRLNESKTAMYEKEDTWVAQLRACKQRFGKSEEQAKQQEQTKLQLFTFLGQVREILVRNAQVASIRDLLIHWAPMMNALVYNAFPHTTTTGATSSLSGASSSAM